MELESTTRLFIVAASAAALLGFSKSGFKGLSFIFVSLMAAAYGGKISTGIILPLLILGDTIAVIYFRKDVNWRVLFRLFPPMAVGVLIGTFIGDKIPEAFFKQLMAGIILVSGVLLLIMDRIQKKVPENKVFAIAIGLAAGFCTMIGNLAGPLANLYFLSLQFPKRAFIDTTAWLFFFINIFKLPFHIWVWGTINVDTVQENLILAPFVLVGFFIGLQFIEKISNAFFQKYVIGMTILGAILILGS